MAKRRKASDIAVWIILALLVVGLVGFGTTDFGGSTRAVGRVGAQEIGIDDYARELQGELRALQAQTGQAFSLAEAQALGLDRQVLARLVGRAALDDTAAQMGLSVGDATVAEEIARIDAFAGLDGSFDPEAYRFALQNSGLTVAEFEARVRQEAARNILQAAVVDGIVAPDTFVDTLYAWAREERDITWATLATGDLDAPVPTPTEADLVAFHEAEAARFTLPETKAITYAWLTPEMLLDEVAPAEDDLRRLYEERAEIYDVPARRLVERLAFRSAEDAAAARAQLDAGEATFDDLVAARGLELADIDMGDVAEADLGEAGAEVFALDGPGVAGPLPSQFGPALYRVNAILAATQTPFEDVADELRAELASDRARRGIDDRREALDDQLAGGATLEDLAAETEMETGRIDWRPGTEEGIAAYPAFRTAAEAAEPGDYPELQGFEGGGLFALRVDEVRPPVLQPLEEVREAVAAAWIADRTQAALVARAEAVAEAIRGGGDFSAQGLEPRDAAGLARDAFVDGAPEALLEAVFAMATGEVAVLPSADGAVVVRVDRIAAAAADDAIAQSAKTAFAERAGQQIAADALQMFIRAVQARQGVEINDQAVAAVNAQLN